MSFQGFLAIQSHMIIPIRGCCMWIKLSRRIEGNYLNTLKSFGFKWESLLIKNFPLDSLNPFSRYYMCQVSWWNFVTVIEREKISACFRWTRIPWLVKLATYKLLVSEFSHFHMMISNIRFTSPPLPPIHSTLLNESVRLSEV